MRNYHCAALQYLMLSVRPLHQLVKQYTIDWIGRVTNDRPMLTVKCVL